MKTLKQLAQNAMDVQDACNLSGVVHSFSRDISDLRKLFPNQGTDFFNTHPISVLYSSKIASLTRSEDLSRFTYAFDQCHTLKDANDETQETNSQSDPLRQ